ncbi:cytochrome C [bacterium (Candidatus Blackallbacteria) CG17_big_fil_post_rev_8_21_14_2_50_48_46]|uniref:Cytochrome C n=1 Tax=bacterium (Candidatus Blackallbacteria) CG17_big_fil_post_rev_8_21_14_2_50_48_46 TaxID=2014261 RepID=A0A2M7G0F2_9BACT|nr:MAG: cytochrome C [bacterium (Candidatus Blackallbacteria) CG18_big_fil_WC_8_21_14_2_50_49_26]PIW15041.1 MAG: cytochrome C [bacterium (Candidatus Blackallbacteria) CG17_big_fil_post_rev_8_21_14_2_50_48_46]PIW47636.1 MAG: cytochrome C [bacterium (Candidatus Blackallbacteria) CG13_big_fil_rev_8_21_14_2_50_49_14]
MKRSYKLSLFIASLGLVSAFLLGCPASQTSENKTETTTSAAPADVPLAEAGADGKGIGPVKTVELTALDTALVAEGQKTFESKCASCHKFEAKYVGPALKGVTERRKPEWIMNMILNSTEMVQKDPEAKKLFATFMMAMPNQNMDEKSARAVLEYFRSMDEKK